MKKYSIITCCIYIMVFLSSFFIHKVQAQEIMLKGKVTSYEGKPLFGISVDIKNKEYRKWAGSTDSLGNFSCTVYNGDTLHFSGLQIPYGYTEIVNGNNFIHARIPLRKWARPGPKIEANEVESYKEPILLKRVIKDNGERVFDAVSDPLLAEPKKGWRTFGLKLEKDLQYPEEAIKNHIQGEVVAAFTITRYGLKNLKIIKGIGSGCDEEALRVLSLPYEWRPGIQNGRPVDQEYEYSITFKLKKK